VNTATYRHIVREMCDEVRVRDWELVLASGGIVVDGQLVHFSYDEQLAPGALTVWLDLGEMPEGGVALHLLHSDAGAPGRPAGSAAGPGVLGVSRRAYLCRAPAVLQRTLER
jgi:hypothetical protein